MRLLGRPVSVAAFVGGDTGECLKREFAQTGVRGLTVDARGKTRCCYTVIDHSGGVATELTSLRRRYPGRALSRDADCYLRNSRHGVVSICGSLPPESGLSFMPRLPVAHPRTDSAVLDVAKEIGCVQTRGPSRRSMRTIVWLVA